MELWKMNNAAMENGIASKKIFNPYLVEIFF